MKTMVKALIVVLAMSSIAFGQKKSTTEVRPETTIQKTAEQRAKETVIANAQSARGETSALVESASKAGLADASKATTIKNVLKVDKSVGRTQDKIDMVKGQIEQAIKLKEQADRTTDVSQKAYLNDRATTIMEMVDSLSLLADWNSDAALTVLKQIDLTSTFGSGKDAQMDAGLRKLNQLFLAELKEATRKGEVSEEAMIKAVMKYYGLATRKEAIEKMKELNACIKA